MPIPRKRPTRKPTKAKPAAPADKVVEQEKPITPPDIVNMSPPAPTLAEFEALARLDFSDLILMPKSDIQNLFDLLSDATFTIPFGGPYKQVNDAQGHITPVNQWIANLKLRLIQQKAGK